MSEGQPRTAGDQPTVVNQTVVMVGAPKNPGLAFVLTLLLGPLGMLYSTMGGAFTMFAVGLIMVFMLGSPLFLLLLIPINVYWSLTAVRWHNEDLEAAAKQLAEQGPQASSLQPTPGG